MEENDKVQEESANTNPEQQQKKKEPSPIRLEDTIPAIIEKTGLPEYLVSEVVKGLEKQMMLAVMSGRNSLTIEGIGTIHLHKFNSDRRKRRGGRKGN